VRVRILKSSEGIIQGVSLSRLLPGVTYEVPLSLGTFLIGQGAAEEDVTPAVELVIPIDIESSALTGGVSVASANDLAAGRTPTRETPRKPTE
jgi:hypothetical protein